MAQGLTALQRRRARVRVKISGSAQRPRLAVKITNQHVLAQLIDDQAGKTLAYATTVRAKEAKGTLTEKAAWVGDQVAEAAKKHKIKAVVFDRGGRIYHGRLKALAEAARKGGLEF